jgi:hypothetical protein
MSRLNRSLATAREIPTVVVASTIVVLALITVHLQVTGLRMAFVETEQVKRHLAVLGGTAPSPWQYRILAEYVIEAVAWPARRLGVPDALVLTFLSVRVAQNAAMLFAAYVYYRRLGVPTAAAVVGLNLLALAMLQADLESDLSFNTYFDVIFYLLAACAVLSRRWWWVVPIAMAGAFNRETSALIPLLPLAGWTYRDDRSRILRVAGVALVAWAVIFVSIRWWYGPRPLMLGWGHAPGLSLFLFNMRRYSWVRMVAMFGTLPLLALVGYRRWPHELKTFCWLIVPIWFGVHAFSSVLTETRLLLVPLVLVVLPGCLLMTARDGDSRLVRRGAGERDEGDVG